MKKNVLFIFALAMSLSIAAQDTLSGFNLTNNYLFYPYWPSSEDSLYISLGYYAGPFMKGESAKAFYTADSLRITGIAAALYDIACERTSFANTHYIDTTYRTSKEFLRIYETRWDTLVAIREATIHMRHTPVSYYIDFGPENMAYTHQYFPRLEAVYECMFEPITVCDTFLVGRSWYLNELFPVPGATYQMQAAPEIATVNLSSNGIKPDFSFPPQKMIECMWSNNPYLYRAYVKTTTGILPLIFPIIGEPDTNSTPTDPTDTTEVGVERHDLAWRYTSVYPNPATGPVRVTSSFELGLIEVYSPEGVLIHSQQTSGLVAKLDVSAWPSGTYMLRISTCVGTVTKKLVVRR